jgi:O-antigen/teichoic acid export membrane protein
MGRGRRIALNTTWLVLAQLAGAVAGLFVVGHVADRLTPAGYGELEGVTSFATLFTPLVFLGIQLILIREICATPSIASRAVADALVIRAVALPLFAGGILLIGPVVIPGVDWTLLGLGAVNLYLVYYLQCFELPFEAFERMHFIALGTLACYVVGLSLSLVAVHLELGPVGVMAARALAVLTQTAVLAVSAWAVRLGPRLSFDARRCATTLRQGLPLLLSMALNLYLLEFGRTTLASSRDAAEVGLYSSAASLSSKFILFVHALTQAVQPALCKAWLDGRDEYADLLGRVLRFVLILTVPLASGSFFVAGDLVEFIFGDQYADAGGVMAVLMCAIHLQFLSSVLSASVVARGREVVVIVGAVIAVAVNIALSIGLIPTYGYLAAGLVTVASQAVLVVFFFVVQRDVIGVILRQLKLARVIAANALLVGACVLLRDLGAVVVIAGAASVYGVAVLALRCIDRAEIRSVLGR